MIRKKQGFTLLEMSIVLVIIAVVMGGGAVIFAASLQKKQYDETKGKLQFLQQKLLEYRRTYNRLPCPADISSYGIQASNGYFGVEAPSPGACTGGPPTARFSAMGRAAFGMIPTKALKLPDDYAFDGWGRRIAYAVDGDLTATDAFLTIPITDTLHRMTVASTSSPLASITDYAAYVLVSYGANGHGAYSRANGTSAPALINANSTNVDEQVNCICGSNAVSTSPTDNTWGELVFVQKLPTQDTANSNHTNDFDDIVVYGTRKDLRSVSE